MQELAIFALLFTAVKGFAAQALTIQNEKKKLQKSNLGCENPILDRQNDCNQS
jgi:hypothetical protein